MAAALLVLLLLVPLVSASHYFGASATFSFKGKNPDGSLRVDIRKRATFDGCYQQSWYCYQGNCGTVTQRSTGVIDRSTNAPQSNRQWCETEEVSSWKVWSDKPFQMRTRSCCWIPTRNSVSSWSWSTLVDLGRRSDTRQPNRSPDIAILPFLRVPQNCPRTYKLMSFDPDGDKVRCRYGNVLHRYVECGGCSQPAGFHLDQDSCTLHYRLSSADPRVFGMEMVVEDFPKQHINLTYRDGSRVHRSPLRLRRKRQATWSPAPPATTPWSWWTTTAPPARTPWSWWTTTAPPARTSWRWWTTTAPPATTPWRWWTTTAPPARTPWSWWTTTAPPATTPWRWWTTTAPPATTPWRWWTTTAPPARTPWSWWTTTAPPATTPWRWWTTTAPPATTPWRWWTTTAPPARTPWSWWTTTAPPATTPWRWWTTTAPPTTTQWTTTVPPTTTQWTTTVPPTTTQWTTTAPPTTTQWTTTAPPARTSWTTTAPPTTTPWTTTAPPTPTPWRWTPPQSTTRQLPPTTTTRPQVSTAPPLSKLPLQFSVLVDPPVPSCQDGLYLPKLVHPTPADGARLQAEVDKLVEIRVKAVAALTSIHNIILSGPMHVTKRRTTHGEFVIGLRPAADELGEHYPVCFAVEAVERSATTRSPTTPSYNTHHHHASTSRRSVVYQSEMRCVLLDVVKEQIKTHVTCSESSMRVEVEKSSLSGLHEDRLRLSDPSNTACSLRTLSNGSHVVGVIPLNACGTQIEEDENNLIFRNEITTWDDSETITRKHLLDVQFYCQYPKRGNVTLNFVAHRKKVTVWDRGMGTFTYQFEFYPDETYGTMINPSTYPLVYKVGSRIYMQIEATTSVGNTVLFVETCRASPYDTPNYTPTYSIIENGCSVDPTVEIYNSTHRTKFQFSIEAFKFIGLYDQVYISCSVLMCEAGNGATRCSQGCMNATWTNGDHDDHHRRRRRAAVTQSASHFVSQGPLRLSSAAEEAGSSVTLNLNLVFVAGCLLAAVAMISALVLYRTKMSTVGYQRLPAAEI